MQKQLLWEIAGGLPVELRHGGYLREGGARLEISTASVARFLGDLWAGVRELSRVFTPADWPARAGGACRAALG